jgi:predicted regulator of Ras-like GTPase activity (Roadblock/LC7/MglB family)
MNNRKSGKGSYNLRSGLVIFPSQQGALDRTLGELAHKIPAYFLLLADVTGQIISVRGEQMDTNLVALGSLVAGDLAASQEIARLTGQYEGYQLILREGQDAYTFIAEAGRHLVLFIQIANDVPLGWARMLIQKASHQLTDIVTSPPQQEDELEQPDFELDLDSEDLPDLFSDALDELWKE